MGNCGDCMFFNPYHPGWSSGECRHNAPFVGVDPEGVRLGPWPSVSLIDFCGQYKADTPRSGSLKGYK